MGVDVGAGATYSFETLLYIEQLHSANSNIEPPSLCQGLLHYLLSPQLKTKNGRYPSSWIMKLCTFCHSNITILFSRATLDNFMWKSSATTTIIVDSQSLYVFLVTINHVNVLFLH